jgi:hypothetical protein
MTAGADRGSPPAAPEVYPYHRIQLAGLPGRWRQVLGIVLMVAWLGLFAALVVSIPFALWYAVHGDDVGAALTALGDTDRITPSSLAYIDLVLATPIGMAILLSWRLHRVGARWLLSVAGRLRWRLLFACFGCALVTLMATFAVQAVVPQQCDVPASDAHLSRTVVAYLLVILLLTPFQASGEEFMFRGYLTQCLGALSRRAWVPVLVTGLVFGAFHGFGQPLPVFLSRFAFGLVAGYLVIRTGGLEAGIAMHTLNNWLSLGIAAVYDQMSTTLDPSCNSWWAVPVTLTQSVVYLALVVLVCRTTQVATTTAPSVLEAPRSRV